MIHQTELLDGSYIVDVVSATSANQNQYLPTEQNLNLNTGFEDTQYLKSEQSIPDKENKHSRNQPLKFQQDSQFSSSKKSQVIYTSIDLTNQINLTDNDEVIRNSLAQNHNIKDYIPSQFDLHKQQKQDLNVKISDHNNKNQYQFQQQHHAQSNQIANNKQFSEKLLQDQVMSQFSSQRSQLKQFMMQQKAQNQGDEMSPRVDEMVVENSLKCNLQKDGGFSNPKNSIPLLQLGKLQSPQKDPSLLNFQNKVQFLDQQVNLKQASLLQKANNMQTTTKKSSFLSQANQNFEQQKKQLQQNTFIKPQAVRFEHSQSVHSSSTQQYLHTQETTTSGGLSHRNVPKVTQHKKTSSIGSNTGSSHKKIPGKTSTQNTRSQAHHLSLRKSPVPKIMIDMSLKTAQKNSLINSSTSKGPSMHKKLVSTSQTSSGKLKKSVGDYPMKSSFAQRKQSQGEALVQHVQYQMQDDDQVQIFDDHEPSDEQFDTQRDSQVQDFNSKKMSFHEMKSQFLNSAMILGQDQEQSIASIKEQASKSNLMNNGKIQRRNHQSQHSSQKLKVNKTNQTKLYQQHASGLNVNQSQQSLLTEKQMQQQSHFYDQNQTQELSMVGGNSANYSQAVLDTREQLQTFQGNVKFNYFSNSHKKKSVQGLPQSSSQSHIKQAVESKQFQNGVSTTISTARKLIKQSQNSELSSQAGTALQSARYPTSTNNSSRKMTGPSFPATAMKKKDSSRQNIVQHKQPFNLLLNTKRKSPEPSFTTSKSLIVDPKIQTAKKSTRFVKGLKSQSPSKLNMKKSVVSVSAVSKSKKQARVHQQQGPTMLQLVSQVFWRAYRRYQFLNTLQEVNQILEYLALKSQWESTASKHIDQLITIQRSFRELKRRPGSLKSTYRYQKNGQGAKSKIQKVRKLKEVIRAWMKGWKTRLIFRSKYVQNAILQLREYEKFVSDSLADPDLNERSKQQFKLNLPKSRQQIPLTINRLMNDEQWLSKIKKDPNYKSLNSTLILPSTGASKSHALNLNLDLIQKKKESFQIHLESNFEQTTENEQDKPWWEKSNNKKKLEGSEKKKVVLKRKTDQVNAQQNLNTKKSINLKSSTEFTATTQGGSMTERYYPGGSDNSITANQKGSTFLRKGSNVKYDPLQAARDAKKHKKQQIQHEKQNRLSPSPEMLLHDSLTQDQLKHIRLQQSLNSINPGSQTVTGGGGPQINNQMPFTIKLNQSQVFPQSLLQSANQSSEQQLFHANALDYRSNHHQVQAPTVLQTQEQIFGNQPPPQIHHQQNKSTHLNHSLSNLNELFSGVQSNLVLQGQQANTERTHYNGNTFDTVKRGTSNLFDKDLGTSGSNQFQMTSMINPLVDLENKLNAIDNYTSISTQQNKQQIALNTSGQVSNALGQQQQASNEQQLQQMMGQIYSAIQNFEQMAAKYYETHSANPNQPDQHSGCQNQNQKDGSQTQRNLDHSEALNVGYQVQQQSSVQISPRVSQGLHQPSNRVSSTLEFNKTLGPQQIQGIAARNEVKKTVQVSGGPSKEELRKLMPSQRAAFLKIKEDEEKELKRKQELKEMQARHRRTVSTQQSAMNSLAQGMRSGSAVVGANIDNKQSFSRQNSGVSPNTLKRDNTSTQNQTLSPIRENVTQQANKINHIKTIKEVKSKVDCWSTSQTQQQNLNSAREETKSDPQHKPLPSSSAISRLKSPTILKTSSSSLLLNSNSNIGAGISTLKSKQVADIPTKNMHTSPSKTTATCILESSETSPQKKQRRSKHSRALDRNSSASNGKVLSVGNQTLEQESHQTETGRSDSQFLKDNQEQVTKLKEMLKNIQERLSHAQIVEETESVQIQNDNLNTQQTQE